MVNGHVSNNCLESRGNRVPAAGATSRDIVIQDAASLLNLAGNLGEQSMLEVKRIPKKTDRQTGQVFEVCRTKPAEFLCTFNKTQNRPVMQCLFRCLTCKFSGKEDGLCTVCLSVCHGGHQLEYLGARRYFCCCGAKNGDSTCLALTGKGQTNSLLCTYKQTGTTGTEQHFFTCVTCKLVDQHGICAACVNVCHAGHYVRYAKQSPKFFCDCGHRGNCKALNL